MVKPVVKKLVVAGVAAAVLAAGGGSTFALWSESQNFASGIITGGDLALSAPEHRVFDTSPDRAGRLPIDGTGLYGIAIDPATFAAVPGDEILFQMDTNVTLHGDNMVAGLALDGLNYLRKLTDGANNTTTVQVQVRKDGQDLMPRTNIYQLPGNATSIPLVTLGAANLNGTIAGYSPTHHMLTGETDEIQVLVFVNFAGQNRGGYRAEIAALQNLGVSLTQQRAHQAVFATP
jgi:alternate signal-mediated exported protein